MKNLLNRGNHREKYEKIKEESTNTNICRNCVWFNTGRCSWYKKNIHEMEVACNNFIRE